MSIEGFMTHQFVLATRPGQIQYLGWQITLVNRVENDSHLGLRRVVRMLFQNDPQPSAGQPDQGTRRVDAYAADKGAC